MKTLKQLLFAVAVMVCLSMTALAQKDGDKKNPPKDKTPVVPIVPKKDDKPKDDKPKDDKKKPEVFMIYFKDE